MPPAKRKPPVVKPAGGDGVTLDEPLEFLRASTYRQRQVCLTIERFAAGEAQSGEIIAASEYLSVEYPLHLFDMAEDLLALLSARCKPTDNIAPIVEELAETQKTVRVLAAKTVKVLVAQLQQLDVSAPTRSAQRLARELLVVLRRLSAIESGIILPLARVRLSDDDLTGLSLRLRKRRGLVDHV